MFNGEVSVHGPVQGTRLPGSESGACWLVPCSPWPRPFAPPTPAPVARRRSPASQLLWRGLTSRLCASSASAHHLPDADQGATALARREPDSPDAAASTSGSERARCIAIGARKPLNPACRV